MRARARREMGTDGGWRPDAVEAEGAPVFPPAVPRHEVPAAARVDHTLRVYPALTRGPADVGVAEAHAELVTAGAGQGREQGRVDDGADAVERRDGGAQGIGTFAQARGHHLLEFHDRAQCRLFDAAHHAQGRGAQRDGHGQRLIVVQQQRWQRLAGTEGVAPGHAAAGLDGVAQLAQAVDVAPQGAGVNLKPLSQLGARPVAAGLKQREQAQQAGRRGEHAPHSSPHRGPILSAMVPTVKPINP